MWYIKKADLTQQAKRISAAEREQLSVIAGMTSYQQPHLTRIFPMWSFLITTLVFKISLNEQHPEWPWAREIFFFLSQTHLISIAVLHLTLFQLAWVMVHLYKAYLHSLVLLLWQQDRREKMDSCLYQGLEREGKRKLLQLEFEPGLPNPVFVLLTFRFLHCLYSHIDWVEKMCISLGKLTLLVIYVTR